MKMNVKTIALTQCYISNLSEEHNPNTPANATHRQVYNIRRTLVGNNIVDHSDVDEASPVGAAPTTSSFST